MPHVEYVYNKIDPEQNYLIFNIFIVIQTFLSRFFLKLYFHQSVRRNRTNVAFL